MRVRKTHSVWPVQRIAGISRVRGGKKQQPQQKKKKKKDPNSIMDFEA